MIHQKYELSSDGLDLCKGKLVPGVVATWGEIVGDIENQADLVEYVRTHGGGGGDAVWGSITGTITDQEDLMTLLDDYATQDWVEGKGYLVSADLSQYATRQWVTGRGYITSDALDGYATEQWVGQQGYITSSALSGYATESWVTGQGYITSSALSGYATETWVGQQGYITSSALSGYATESWVENHGYVEAEEVDDMISDAIGDGDLMRLVDREGIDFPVVDRPDGNPGDPDQYLSSEYILGLEKESAYTSFVYVTGPDLYFVDREYVEENGEMVLSNEWEGNYYRQYPGYSPIENCYLPGNPDFTSNPVPEDYPIENCIYNLDGKLNIGYMDTDVWEFNGIKLDPENNEYGLYKITPVEDGSEITYEEEFKSFALDEDLSALASRVSALETNYGNAITITNNILS